LRESRGLAAQGNDPQRVHIRGWVKSDSAKRRRDYPGSWRTSRRGNLDGPQRMQTVPRLRIRLRGVIPTPTGDFNLYIRITNLQGWAGYENLPQAGVSWIGLSGLDLYNYQPETSPTEPLYLATLLDRLDHFSRSGLPVDGACILCLDADCGPTGNIDLDDDGANVLSGDPLNYYARMDNDYWVWGCDYRGIWGGASTTLQHFRKHGRRRTRTFDLTP
jgi:hypothetical protein